jgi:hypothetical protein
LARNCLGDGECGNKKSRPERPAFYCTIKNFLASITWQVQEQRQERLPVHQRPERQQEQQHQRPERQQERQQPGQQERVQEPVPELQQQVREQEQEQLLLFYRKQTKKRPTGRRAGASVSSCIFPFTKL